MSKSSAVGNVRTIDYVKLMNDQIILRAKVSHVYESNGNYLFFDLENDWKAICSGQEFSDTFIKGVHDFIGVEFPFLILSVETDKKVVLVSVKKAEVILKTRFWDELKNNKEEALSKIYPAVVNGINPRKDVIYLSIEGQDCFMKQADWDFLDRTSVDIFPKRGAVVQVKIKQYDPVRMMVRVSRKRTLSDPFLITEDLKKKLENEEMTVGRINSKGANGIFVELEEGFKILGYPGNHSNRDNYLVGQFVPIILKELNSSERTGRCVIIG